MDTYEKKYKEALERANEYHCDGVKQCIIDTLEYIFPELKDSKDGKIRETLIRFHKSTIDIDGIKGCDIIAWLEKQGEQKPADKVETKFKVWDSIKTTNEETLTITKIDDKGYWSEDLFICGFDDAAKWELVEQKSDDKVKPKFHEGDWISGYYINCKVTAINSKGYVVEDTEGNKINILFENEKFHHLFTIDDAKDGDVLACNEEILLFKSYSVQGRISLYCRYNEQTTNFHSKGVTDVSITTKDKIYPATKEQRELLFKKMHEAGYTFDFDKKELKKVEQKSAWSKEDEEIALGIEQVMICASFLNIVPDKIDRIRTWLKSLKERLS